MNEDNHQGIEDVEQKDDGEKAKKKQSWFGKWINRVTKMEQWDEQSCGCLFFPFSCY